MHQLNHNHHSLKTKNLQALRKVICQISVLLSSIVFMTTTINPQRRNSDCVEVHRCREKDTAKLIEKKKLPKGMFNNS